MQITRPEIQQVSASPTKANIDERQAKLLKLQKACKDFESIFIYYLLKTMRSEDSKNNLFGGGLGSDIFMQMFDQGLADKMASSGQLGIANQIYGQYAAKVDPEAKVIHNATPHQPSKQAPELTVRPDPNAIPPEDKPVTILETTGPKIATPEIKPKTKTRGNLDNYQSIISEAATAHNVDPNLVKAVILQESGGNPKAVSAKGAKGLMQLMDGTARMLGITNPFDIRENIFGGVKYLSELLDKFEGNIKNALAAYNAGPAAVKKYGGVPPYDETANFVKSVMANFNGLFKSDNSR